MTQQTTGVEDVHVPDTTQLITPAVRVGVMIYVAPLATLAFAVPVTSNNRCSSCNSYRSCVWTYWSRVFDFCSSVAKSKSTFNLHTDFYSTFVLVNSTNNFSELRLSNIVLILRKCYGYENTDNRYYDHQFNKSKTILITFLHFNFPLF